jgi:hypothetical protein
LEVGVNITILNHTICLAGLGLIMCVSKYLTLNEVEMVVICDGESAEGKVCGIYQSPAPRGLKTGWDSNWMFPERNKTLILTASMHISITTSSRTIRHDKLASDHK